MFRQQDKKRLQVIGPLILSCAPPPRRPTPIPTNTQDIEPPISSPPKLRRSTG
jgi:hypothetical protein